MAKDLPFFKFYCSEWNDGDITLEDYNVQGVFINVCSYYWSKECTVTEKLLKKRFRDCIDIIDLLVKENHLKVVSGDINITFLDEQYSEVENTSSARSKAGKKSARIKKIRKEIIEHLAFISTETNISLTELEKEYNINSTSVDFLLQQNSTIKIRREKIREDNIVKGNEKNIKDLDVNLNGGEGEFKDQLKKDLEEVESQYTEIEFIEDWGKCRIHFMGKPSNLDKLLTLEKADFNKSKGLYSKRQIKDAMVGLFSQKNKNIGSMYLRPKHFLEPDNISKYLTAFGAKEFELYGKEKEKVSL